ncbi:MAG: tetratricopeptide repeat protein [Chitinophagales bacterium]
MAIIPEEDIIARFNNGCKDFIEAHRALDNKEIGEYKAKSRTAAVEVFGAMEAAMKTYLWRKTRNKELAPEDYRLLKNDYMKFSDLMPMFKYYSRPYISDELHERIVNLKNRERNKVEHGGYVPGYNRLKESVEIVYDIIKIYLQSKQMHTLLNVKHALAQLSTTAASQGKQKYLTNTPERPITFIGRKVDLGTVNQKLYDHQIVLMHGIGGVGKTTIARQYFYAYGHLYDHLVWLNCFTTIQDAILSQLPPESLGLVFAPNDPVQERFDKVMLMLKNMEGRNLMIIDGADDAEDIQKNRQVLSSLPSWHVLVTTRTYLTYFVQHKVGLLSDEEALKVFYKHYTHQRDDKHLSQLLNVVGRHTLTVELLAKNLQELQDFDDYTIKDLLNNLAQNNLLQFSESVDVYTPYNNKEVDLTELIPTIFNVNELSDYEQDLMRQLSVLPSEAITYVALKTLFQIDDETQKQFRSALRNLLKKGWIVTERASKTYQMHKVIQEVVRDKLRPNSENCSTLIEGLYELIKVKKGESYLDKVKYLHFAEKILQYIYDPVKPIAYLSNSISLIHKALGNLEKALNAQHLTIAILEQDTTENQRDLGIAYNNIALIYQFSGDLDKALTYQHSSIKIREKALEPNNRGLATAYNNIAIMYREWGNLNEALKYQLNAVSIRETELLPKHPDLAAAYNNLALICRALEDFTTALLYQDKVIEIAEEILGEQHPHLATYYSNLSLIYKGKNYLLDAIEAQRKAILIREAILPRNHPDLGISYTHLADFYTLSGETDLAISYIEEAVVILEKRFPANHPKLQKALVLQQTLKGVE